MPAPPGVDRARLPRARFRARALRAGARRIPYRVYIPSGDAPPRGWPVVLFLHGSGERGSDGVAPTRVGLGPAIRERPEAFPLVAIFPQAPAGRSWSGRPLTDALGALDAVARHDRTDRERVYLVGLSMGGYGVWQLGVDCPERFAALVAVCGGVRPLPGASKIFPVRVPDPTGDPYRQIAHAVRAIPTWIFHGREDTAVPVAESRRMAAELEALDAPARYTELAHVGHNVWDAAFHAPDLWSWLLAQRRRSTV